MTTPTDKHTFLGKRLIAYTQLCDFTDYQGIGEDPLYRRYASVQSIVKRAIDPRYVSFLAIPDQPSGDDKINWYIPEWTENPQRFTELTGSEAARYRQIKEQTVNHYRQALNNLSGEELMVMGSVLRYISDDFIYCADNNVYVLAWGMTPDSRKHVAIGEIIHVAPNLIRYNVTFDPAPFGSLHSEFDAFMRISGGTVMRPDLIPHVTPDDRHEFTGWSPNPDGYVIETDTTFTALYSEKEIPVEKPPVIPDPDPRTFDSIVTFDAGEHGTIKGNCQLTKPFGTKITESEIPQVIPTKGYTFKGWNIDPLAAAVNSDMLFTARYEKVEPWWRKYTHGWWRWLWILLLLLLLLWLLSKLFPGCTDSFSGFGCDRLGCDRWGCDRSELAVADTDADNIDDTGTSADDAVIPFDPDAPDADMVARPIDLIDDRLPTDEDWIVAPIRDPDGKEPEIIRNPGVPPAMAGRLFLFLEDEDSDIDKLASDFKNAYPGDEYRIIGYDKEVKSLSIQVPERLRDKIRNELPQRLPAQKFLIMDEQIYEINNRQPLPTKGTGWRPSSDATGAGWHLKAIHAEQAWAITKGSPSVIVAVVDDGFDGTHPMFKGRIVKPYNVFTQDNRLSVGSGHGTHTAGLAAGNLQFKDRGAAGMAPECKIMPIQVFDHDMCPTSAIISGIMYAVHKGADVVNVSIGPTFNGLEILPEEQQAEIARTHFKNEEILWRRVSEIAARKGTIIVFAAGNETILSAILPENRTKSAISVGAVDQAMRPSNFSNYGTGTDLSAPGSNIMSAIPGSKIEMMDGTSMAAPIVSGTIALMKSLKKDLTVEQAYNVLYRTGAPVNGDLPPCILADKALQAVKSGDFSAPARKPADTYQPAPTQPTRPVNDNEAILQMIRDRKAQIEELNRQVKELEGQLK